jgi:hypothetical protein
MLHAVGVGTGCGAGAALDAEPDFFASGTAADLFDKRIPQCFFLHKSSLLTPDSQAQNIGSMSIKQKQVKSTTVAQST